MYTGIEPSKHLLERSKTLYAKSNIDFLEGNAYEIPTESNVFDGVFSTVVWLHLENLEAAAKELWRVLKPKGSFYIITANPQAYSSWEALFESPIKTDKKIEGKVKIPGNPLSKNVIYFHSEKELLNSFTSLGLKIKGTEKFGSDVASGTPNYFITLEGSKP